MKKSLSIAGSDCSGGAGVQADLKTMGAHGIYGMTVITSITAQNTTGVKGIDDIEPDFVKKQMDAVFNDIYPDSVKVGMLSNAEIVRVVSETLKYYNAQNIVLDPVMISTSGSKLLSEEAIELLKEELIVFADIVTPNIPEAEKLSGIDIECRSDMVRAAKAISKNTRGYVLVKGGHLEDRADDLLYSSDGETIWLESEKIENPNTHGTGCTLSSAIASNMALGHSVEKSVFLGKEYINRALKSGLDLGSGRGPLNHLV